MASEIKSDKLSPSTGTALQIGDASDTITIPTGATFTITDGLGVAGGGTGLTSFAAGDVLYATGTTTLAKLAKGTAEQILSMNSGATAPEWTTAAATAGGTGQTGFTAGDILYANSTTTLTKLAKGTGLQGLQTNSGATAPEWTNSPQSVMTATGDILYASGANTLAKLAKGSDDEVLTLASGVPSWAAAAGGGAWNFIKSQAITTSTNTMDFVHGTGGVVFDGTYQTYICMFSGGTMGTTASKLYCQVAVSSVFQTSGYLAFENAGKYNGSASASTYDVTAASLISTGCVYGTDTDAAFVGHIQFGDPSVVAEKKSAIFQTMTPFDNASNLRTFVGAGAFQTAGAIDGFRFIPSTGNFLTLRASLYGLTFA